MYNQHRIPENFLIQYFKNKLSTYQEESNQILSNQQFVQNQNPKIYKTIDIHNPEDKRANKDNSFNEFGSCTTSGTHTRFDSMKESRLLNDS